MKTPHQTPIRFTKMHGLGNDFVIINTINQSLDVQQLSIKLLADRHTGIGFDQLLLIAPSHRADIFCRIYNADGSEVEQCGNGLRCIARFLHEEGLHREPSVHIETKAGIFSLFIKDYDHIRVAMGTPLIQEKLIELKSTANSMLIPTSILSLGNPHAIIKVESIDSILADQLGPEISSHSLFHQGANVGFMQVMNPHHIRLRTFERGVGETHACGSNACAAVVAGMANGWLTHQVNVDFRYGSLSIEWEGTDKPVYMTGPASRIFSGEVILANETCFLNDRH